MLEEKMRLDEKGAAPVVLTSVKGAGADIIITTYFAEQLAALLRE